MNDKQNNRIYSGASPEKVTADLKPLLEFSDQGLPLAKIAELIDKHLIPHFVRYDLPQFHSLYNCFPEKGAELGAQTALRYNQGVTNWIVSPGGVMLEELCGRAMCRLFGLGPEADATFMYCGTYANQQALYMALHYKAEQQGFDLAEKGIKGFKHPERLAVLASEEAHFSLRHAVRMLGLGEESLLTIPVDNNFRMDIPTLYNNVKTLQSEREIFCITATAGTTSSGSLDPIQPAAELCQQINSWLHVDGAYGLAFSLLPDKNNLFEGLQLADSITWDPHKQFGMPIPNSMLFVRNREQFDRMAIYGKYFNRENDPEPNPGTKSPPSTRPLSALPLVTSILHLGMEKIRARLAAPVKTVENTYTELMTETDIELCHRPDTGILCLRLRPQGCAPDRIDALQQHIFDRIKKEAKRSLSLTRLADKNVLRLVAISPNVTSESILETIDLARKIARDFTA